MAGMLEKLDPRSKIISFLAMFCCIILTPITRFRDFGLYFLILLAIVFLARITPGQILKRISLLIPWVVVIAMIVPFIKTGFVCLSMHIGYWKVEITDKGVWTFLSIAVKSSLSSLLLIIISLTTTLSDFLKGLELLHFPRLLIRLLYFVYCCLFLFLYKTRHLLQDKYLRFVGARCRQPLRVIGFMAGILMSKALGQPDERHEMAVLQGFPGEMSSNKDFRISSLDFLFITGIIASLLCIVFGLVYKIECIKSRNVNVWYGLSL
ncbi:MAG: hypothetical protein DCC43_05250 [Candidatus Brocadia sp.]|nr:Nickel transport protein NikQ [Candidatus Brocadia fulgida]MCC6325108.1 hypothetical protein [Candidatus Brocadia sp.]MCE7910486.1 hypothetical protein [Candidatus Brocadia sp. AMX3]MDG5995413.1 hypothetical protein [Candidatus Brocadia sp.]RIK01821.1 MAG: hypothetical protein DCC43_05250 [Candidatus Brocadia sp.]